MIRRILFLTVVLFTVTVNAGLLHCRSGVINAAEISTANITIANFSGFGFSNLPESRAYAIVSLKLNDMRSISIFDYSLNVSGIDFPCAALWKNNRFEYFTGDIRGSGTQQMLFIIDRKLLLESKRIKLMLKSNLSEAKHVYETEVPFTVINSRMPSAPGRIPAEGLLELDEK